MTYPAGRAWVWLNTALLTLVAAIGAFVFSCVAAAADAQGTIVFLFTLPVIFALLAASVYCASRVEKRGVLGGRLNRSAVTGAAASNRRVASLCNINYHACIRATIVAAMLADLISTRRDDLTSVDRKLVAVLLGDPTGAAFMSVRTLAEAAGVHESGVVRLAKKLGLSGYPELRRTLQSQLTERAGSALRVARSISQAPDGDVLGRLAEQEIELLTLARQHIRQKQIQAAANAVARARRVFVWAHGNACILAQMMDRRLRRAGFDTRDISFEGRELAERLVLVERSDLILAFAFRSEPPGLGAVFKHARRVGAPTVLIADMVGATLGVQPTQLLAAPRGNDNNFLTLSVPMLICNALLLTLARQDHGRSISGLQTLDRLHQDLGLNR